MKAIKVLLFLLCGSPVLYGQGVEFGLDWNLSQPLGTMATNMNNALGLNMEVGKTLKAPFTIGAELGFANYGYETSRQQYTFDDGSVTETNVNVSNNIFNLRLTGKHFFRQSKKINPYLSGKAGWSWFTTELTIEDPEDEYSCHPLESDILSRDNTYSVSGGAGLRVDLNALFKNFESKRVYLDLSIHSTRGGAVNYMNTEMNATHVTPDRDVVAKFINTQSQVIHEHHVGYQYHSTLNMIDYRFGIVFTPGLR